MTEEQNNTSIESLLKSQLSKKMELFQSMQKLGLSIQEFGNDIVEYARVGEAYTKYQIAEIPKMVKAAEAFPSFKTNLEYWYNTDQRLNPILENTVEQARQSKELATTAVFHVSSATSTISALIDANTSLINQLEINTPGLDLYKNYGFNPVTPLDRNFLINKLDIELNKFKNDLADHRRGAWETFNSSAIDKKLQAAASMREILRSLIAKWATTDDVMKTDWWKSLKKQKPTYKERLRLLLFGLNDTIDESLLKQILDLMIEICKVYVNLQSFAHGSKKKIDLLESTMRLTEDITFSIFIIRKFYRLS
jgi:hypothetical protein